MKKIRQDQHNQFTEEKTSWWYKSLLPLYIIITIGYLAWRYENTLASIILWYALPLFIIEFYNSITNVIHLYTTKTIIKPIWSPPLEEKTVDIFIPTYNEPEEIVEMTALGAQNIKGIRHVYVLDDGKRESIKKLAERIGVKYGARGVNTHAKAGNMNFGLSMSDAEFVIFVDCDHVPHPSFIERTLGYFKDPKLAFVQTPQVFYNVDSLQFRKLSFRKLWNEQTMFYESIQPAKNIHNAGFFCGSGAILRRAALDSVGGFATGTATEDIHTSLRIHAKGWNSIFLEEKLAFGLAPEDLKEYHDQRVRWGAGSLGLMFRTKDSPLVKKGLSLMQRTCYFNSTNAYFYGGIIKLFYFLLPIIILLTLPLQNNIQTVFTLQYLAIFIPYLILSNLITYIYSRKTFHILFTEQYNVANIFSCIAALKGVLKVQKKFKVSIKSKMLKENHIAYYFILGLLVVMLASEIAGILYWFFVIRETAAELFASQIAISLLWNTYNLILVYSLFEYITAYNKKPRPEHPFFTIKPFNVTINNTPAQLKSISLRGIQVQVDKLIENPTVFLEINKAIGEIQGVIVDKKTLGNSNYVVSVTFTNLSLRQRKELVNFFFTELVADVFRNDFIQQKQVSSMTPALVVQYAQ